MRVLLVVAFAVALVGCAKNPEAIVPMTMPTGAYSNLTCQQLAAEHQKSSSALVAAEAQQRQAVTGDAVGVFLIGVPVSSLTGGDKEGTLAMHKGELVALSAMMQNKGCSVPLSALPAS